MITEKAYAKINLGLDIVGRRDDGYHLVRMLMQSIDLYDVISMEPTEEQGIILDDSSDIPMTENLIYKAARLMYDIYGVRIGSGLRISYEKHIPMAAGMAGGSSDAAAVLRGMNRLFNLNLSNERIAELGVMIGADVPYCIYGGTALSEGIGEVLTQLPDLPETVILVAKPPIQVSTPEAYRDYDSLKAVPHPDIDEQVDAIYEYMTGISSVDRSQSDKAAACISRIAASQGNVLEFVTEPKHYQITELKQCMTDSGALGAMMSGSGPTVFGIFTAMDKAEIAAERIRAAFGEEYFVKVTKTIGQTK